MPFHSEKVSHELCTSSSPCLLLLSRSSLRLFWHSCYFFLSRQAQSHLRTFALAVTTAWSGPSGPFIDPQGSLLLIIDDAFPATPWKTAPHPPSLLPLCSPLYCFTFLRSIHRHRMHVLSILLLIFLSYVSPVPRSMSAPQRQRLRYILDCII